MDESETIFEIYDFVKGKNALKKGVRGSFIDNRDLVALTVIIMIKINSGRRKFTEEKAASKLLILLFIINFVISFPTYYKLGNIKLKAKKQGSVT